MQRVIEQTGEVQRFRSFEEFVMTPPLEGLGSSLRSLNQICQDDKAALDAIDQVTVGKHGSHGEYDNVTLSEPAKKPETGN